MEALRKLMEVMNLMKLYKAITHLTNFVTCNGIMDKLEAFLLWQENHRQQFHISDLGNFYNVGKKFSEVL